MFFIGYGILLLASIFKLNRTFHMLQQNSYMVSRYLKWTKTAPMASYCTSLVAISMVAVLGIWNIWYNIPFLICSLVVLFFSWILNKARQETAIKPLVYTKRVKRMYITATVILVGLFVLSFFMRKWFAVFNTLAFDAYVCGTVFFAVVLSPLFGLIICGVINRPIEWAISNHFINDAKRILKSNKGLKIVGVTGSYGKTGTKFILGRMLSEKYNTLVTPESFNTPMGVVRTVREKMNNTHQVFVCEMGAKRVGDIKELCKIATPQNGIITAVGDQHLSTFKKRENIFKTKFELYDYVKKTDGICFVNGDSTPIREKLPLENAVSYGFGEHNDIVIQNVNYSSKGAEFDLDLDGEIIHLTTGLLGAYNVLNITAAALMAHKMGVSAKEISYAVSSLKPVEHRLEMKPYINGSTVIDDAYNANPEGCLEAVNVLSSFENYKKIIITPGLIELGNAEYEANFNLGKAAGEKCDVIYLVGKKRSEPLAEGVKTTNFNLENLHIVSSFKEAIENVKGYADDSCVILLENDLPDNYLM